MFPLYLLASVVLTDATEIAKALSEREFGRTFRIEGTVTFPSDQTSTFFSLLDGKGFGVALNDGTGNPGGYLRSGYRVLAEGSIDTNAYGMAYARCPKISIIEKASPPAPILTTASELQGGTHDGRLVRIRGIVREVFMDEIDPSWIYILINGDGFPAYAALLERGQHFTAMKRLVASEVSVVGACNAQDDGLRQLIGRIIMVASPDDFTVLKKAPDDPFTAPLVHLRSHQTPSKITSLGRRRLIGKVIATWGNAFALVTDSSHAMHKVKFDDQPSPEYGSDVEIVGFPETDLYCINFANAIWRKTDNRTPYDDQPQDVELSTILTDRHGSDKIDVRFHGRAIRLSGTIMDMSPFGSGLGTITIKSGQFTVPVDVSATSELLHRLSIGCVINVSGTCVIATENWRPNATFPHATGITLVVRTPADVVILSRPSWWTPQRLMVVVGILLLVLVIVFIWNRVLQRVVHRKSLQLLKEQIGQVKAALRVDERTHLAVELHDTLSQNLSGVACQIAATKGTLPDGAGETARYLETAERMLLSCRTELRRCLWDLRGDTLEETNFTEAIRKTLAPVAIGVETIIRFNVPRSRLSDTTAHAVLCIIRELVANAIRHGKARTIRVAGEFHEGALSFSVRDDGRGFDPSNCDGPTEGHFGLEGIRERIKHLDGTFTITSEIGKGTRTEVSLASIQPKDEKLMP